MMATDLTTSYLSLRLHSPLVASASPLTGSVDSLRALEAAGVGAVVLPSLFEEQIAHESLQVHALLSTGMDSHPEAASYFPELDTYNTGPVGYVRHLQAAKAALTVPVIASINGSSPGGWLRYARMLQEAGADAIELNVYRVATNPDTSGRLVEEEVVETVAQVRDAVTVPLAVKLGPHFSSFAHLAVRLAEAGANGLVLFNRFYQPDIDLETLAVSPHLVLSTSDELRLPLRWIAILHGRIEKLSLAATTGIHSGRDVAKALLAGADVTMMASALLRNGPDHLGAVELELREWMERHELASVEQLKGSVSQEAVADPAAFERANYMRTLTTYAGTFV
jgi:dihydroorotate dehydrogenase (fumarate)